VDNVTHALAGLVLAEATVAVRRARGEAPNESFRRAALIAGLVAAELPDADLLYAGHAGTGRLGYLLHHRGHTHTVVIGALLALLVWGVTALATRRRSAPNDNRWLLALCLTATLVGHLALDWTNNYGVHPFWPVDDRWYYGDAVFIVEPWLWVVSIPPLLLLARSAAMRVLLGLLLLVVLGAAWSVPMVERGTATALASGALAWTLLAALTPAPRRAALAGVAWVAVELTFLAASQSARSAVRDAVGPTLVDAALTPAVGDPTCFTLLAVERDGATYRVSAATVAPWPHLRRAEWCPTRGTSRGLGPPTRPATNAVLWTESWSAPVMELAALARDNCDVAAALRFVRVPVWARAGGTIELWDARFGRGGFAGVVTTDRPNPCPRNVPPWTPPRAALLR